MTLDEDQQQLRDAVRKLADGTAVREAIDQPGGYAESTWTQIAQMGLAGIAVDENSGGAGGSWLDLAIALEELGRGLVPSPLFQTAALAAPLLQECGDDHVKSRLLPGIAGGETRATAVFSGSVEASRSGDGWALFGSIGPVVGADTADLVLLPARTDGNVRMFTVRPGDGVSLEPLPVLDLTRPMSTVRLDGAAGEPFGPEDASELLARVLPIARVLLAAEQVGGAQRCVEMAVEYAKTRVQFGRAIGSFQSIKHICADMFTDVECARALVHDAARAVGTDEFGRLAGMAGAWASETAVNAAERNGQVHGGISYTWEHDCHLYLRRARSSERLLRSVRADYETVAASLL